MDETVKEALTKDGAVDITTIGRKTGRPRRIEIWAHYQDGKVYITGSPGRRGWYANLLVHPEFTLHLKQSVRRDVPARATPITDKEKRRQVFARMREREPRMRRLSSNVEAWIDSSPLVEVGFGE